MKHRPLGRILTITALVLAGAVLVGAVSAAVAVRALVESDEPVPSQAVVVLFHDTEIYRRMIEAAALYREGMAKKVVLNGGRKIDVLKEMEAKGFSRDWRWQDEYLPFLEYLGVPREDVVCLDVADAFDTRGEAERVGEKLLALGYRDILVTTNKFHSRRAGLIWRSLYRGRMNVRVVPVRDEELTFSGLWRDGRQFKWVVYEAGSWMFMAIRGLGLEG